MILDHGGTDRGLLLRGQARVGPLSLARSPAAAGARGPEGLPPGRGDGRAWRRRRGDRRGCPGEGNGTEITARATIMPMQVHRVLLETDEKGQLGVVPPLPPHAKVEAIFLVLDPEKAAGVRTPPPELAKLQITGDVVSPAIDLQDWNFAG